MVKSYNFTFIIPARMASSRLHGKPLKKIDDKTVIEHVYNNCIKSSFCKQAIVATDSFLIKDFCNSKNMNCKMTKEHNCASNRVSEVSLKLKDKWIVEVQGDEPFLYRNLIDSWLKKCIKLINEKKSPDIFLSYAKVKYEDSNKFNYVKLLLSNKNKVLWFSRSKIPSDWKGTIESKIYRHTGFHLWKRSSLINFKKIKPSYIEKSEDTHAMRMVENNFDILGVEIPETQAIDTPQDLKKAKNILKMKKNQ